VHPDRRPRRGWPPTDWFPGRGTSPLRASNYVHPNQGVPTYRVFQNVRGSARLLVRLPVILGPPGIRVVGRGAGESWSLADPGPSLARDWDSRGSRFTYAQTPRRTRAALRWFVQSRRRRGRVRVSAPGGIRTHTGSVLSRLSLPVGVPGRTFRMPRKGSFADADVLRCLAKHHVRGRENDGARSLGRSNQGTPTAWPRIT
jgi:hypothetical protein